MNERNDILLNNINYISFLIDIGVFHYINKENVLI